ncbi:MAG: class I SAM-dependent methyltransferase [Patescibacteria group bacterium]|jgi:ubiquinone/menaquinone biosynthesis C-methylase UbiE|nr:class I SAM-dependent methyltransferase [Patescibacteria group bacterium]
MPKDKINFYDDTKHFYEDFWIGRDYEHFSEVLALRNMLNKKHFKVAMDFGGGYGRLSDILLDYSDKVILVDPSTKQLNIAKDKFKNQKNIEYVLINKKNYIPAKDNSIDLLLMVRVSHHVPDPTKLFKDIYRVISPNGYALIEVASNAHFISRLKQYSKFKAVPKTPIKVGSVANGLRDETPFVNHNPETIISELKDCGFSLEKKLSVSNFRNRFLKTHFRLDQLLRAEKITQNQLAKINFGPSIFILVKK